MIFILRDKAIKERCKAYIDKCDGLEVRIGKRSKSSAQRNFFHMLVDIISDFTGESKEVEKMRLKYQILPLETIYIGTEKVLFPISSEDTTKAQYSQLIEAAYQRGGELGLIIPSAASHGLEL